MPTYPQLIVDLHTHFFNARCLPLAGIIANAMGLDAKDSLLARLTARLLNSLTESEYAEIIALSTVDDSADYYIEQLCLITINQLEIPNNYNQSSIVRIPGEKKQAAEEFALQRIKTSETFDCLKNLDNYLVGEGYLEEIKHHLDDVSSLSAWARKIVATTFNKIEMAIKFRDEIQSYPEFFFNMLKAEAHMVHTLIKDYGNDLPQLQLVYHMMDMQKAYSVNGTPDDMVAPKYSFFDTQLLRMQIIQNNHPGQILGFAAFDPRRDNWKEIVVFAKQRGFIGFKFYPAMGYKPIGNDCPLIEQNVLDFFKYCIYHDIPVFTHCTPKGFQTRFEEGLNTHPAIWVRLLNTSGFENLRLCFGHGGGGYETRSNGVKYYGWVAKDINEWNDPDNFARIVASLCRKHKNVYCELAYLTDLFEGSESHKNSARIALKENLSRAMNKEDGEKYDFMTKVSYGSDWHMPSMVRHPRAYLDIFLELFDNRNPVLSAYREMFFWENAYNYLKI